MRGLLAVCACWLMAWAVHRRGGLYDTAAVAVLVAGVILAVAAPRLSGPRVGDRASRLRVPALGALILWQCMELLLAPDAARAQDGDPRWLPLLVVVPALLAVGSCLTGRGLPGRLRFPLVAAGYLAAALWGVAAGPLPAIDVWNMRQGAAEELLQGRNPYSLRLPGEYGWRAMAADGFYEPPHLQSYPFTPLLVLSDLPAGAAGDVRLGLPLLVAAAAALSVAAGRRRGLPAGHPGELAAVALLTHPDGLLVVEYAWKEPLLLAALALGVYALASGRGRLSAVSGGLVAGSVQYGLIVVPFLLHRGRGLPRRVLLAAAVAAAPVLPFALWGLGDLMRGLVGYLATLPPRTDALNLSNLLAYALGLRPPWWAGFLAAGLYILAAAPRVAAVDRRLLDAAAAVALFWMLGKWAFLNYWWGVGGMLLAGVAAGFHPPPRGPSRLSRGYGPRAGG